MICTNARKSKTYWLGTNGVMFTFGCTTRPMANMPPPFFPSKQWANIFFTLPDEASWEIIEELAFPNPSIPSSASSLEASRSPDCLAPHLQDHIKKLRNRRGNEERWIKLPCKRNDSGQLEYKCFQNFRGFKTIKSDVPKYDTPISCFGLEIPSYTVILHNILYKITRSRAPISIYFKIRTRHVSFAARERTIAYLVAKIVITRNQLSAVWFLYVVQCQLDLCRKGKLIRNVKTPTEHESRKGGLKKLTPRVLLLGHCLHWMQFTHMRSLPVSTWT